MYKVIDSDLLAIRKARKRETNREWYLRNKEKVAERDRVWYSENKEHKRNIGLIRKYGITAEQYDEMVKASDGCGICGDTTRRLCVDHCHSTGTVRGLLCDGCNQGIGLMKDSTDNLWKAIQYLSVASPAVFMDGAGI